MKTILTIEDEAIVCKNIQKILRAEGYEALGAGTGNQGLAMARTHNPDLIICDIMMPDLDGYGVLEALQQYPETATIPFIFLTAKVDRSDQRRGIELGADDYLTKPFDTEELLRAIEARFKKQEKFKEKFQLLSQELEKLRHFLAAQNEIIGNFDQELRRPLANIKLALDMLDRESSRVQQEQYLKILQQEFNREIALLNQIADLQKIITPENVEILHQFKLLNTKF